MFSLKAFSLLLTLSLGCLAENITPLPPVCVITNFEDVSNIVSSCIDIVISNVTVPGGQTLEINLNPGSTLTFEGTTAFGHTAWEGPLLVIRGEKVTVQGGEGSILDGQGALYWDGKGDTGTIKPGFFAIEATGGSIFKDLTVLNCPHKCVAIRNSDDLTVTGFNVDVSDGDRVCSILDGQGALYWDGKGGAGTVKPGFFIIEATEGSIFKNLNVINCPHKCVAVSKSSDLTLTGFNVDVSEGDKDSLGHNTDGFNISDSTNIIIEHSVVKNQDDCVVVNQGANIIIRDIHCSGGHGLSFSLGMTSEDQNTVSNVLIEDCVVSDSANGIHVKTHSDGGTGYLHNVEYRNITLSGITNYGVSIQQDYINGGTTKDPKDNIPIIDLLLVNVTGSMTGSKGMAVYIVCAPDACEEFSFEGFEVTGASKASVCNYSPWGYSC